MEHEYPHISCFKAIAAVGSFHSCPVVRNNMLRANINVSIYIFCAKVNVSKHVDSFETLF